MPRPCGRNSVGGLPSRTTVAMTSFFHRSGNCSQRRCSRWFPVCRGALAAGVAWSPGSRLRTHTGTIHGRQEGADRQRSMNMRLCCALPGSPPNPAGSEGLPPAPTHGGTVDRLAHPRRPASPLPRSPEERPLAAPRVARAEPAAAVRPRIDLQQRNLVDRTRLTGTARCADAEIGGYSALIAKDRLDPLEHILHNPAE